MKINEICRENLGAVSYIRTPNAESISGNVARVFAIVTAVALVPAHRSMADLDDPLPSRFFLSQHLQNPQSLRMGMSIPTELHLYQMDFRPADFSIPGIFWSPFSTMPKTSRVPVRR